MPVSTRRRDRAAPGRRGAPRGDRTAKLPLTRMQRDLRRRLPAYSANAADAYDGALHVYHGRCHTDQPSHLAYALRDVVDHLAREMQNDAEKRSTLSVDERAANLRRTFDPVMLQGSAYDGHYRALAEEHDLLSGIAHRRAPPDDLVPFDAMPRIERALHDLSFPQISANRMIDSIMEENPTRARAKELMELMPTGAAQSRVVSRLPPGWLESMDEAGFFRDPGKYRAATGYLLRCVGGSPDRVAGIITKYDPSDVRSHRVMYGDILDCALRMPADDAARVSGFLIEAGLQDMFVHYPDKYLRVAANLCLGGEYTAAMEFARRGLSLANINHPYPGARWLEGPVRKFADAAMGTAPLQLFGLLADLLEAILTSGRPGHAIPDDVSSMMYRRPTVEESDQNVSDLPSSLVALMRSCLAIMGNGGRAQIRRASEITRRRRLLIYRRLELFAYGEFPDVFKSELEDYAVRYIGNPYTYHEHYVMLGRHYGSMSERAKRQISEAIAKFPPQGDHADGGARPGGRKVRDEVYHLRYLECIEDHLDGRQRAIFEALASKHGRAAHPGYLFFRGSGHVRPPRGPGPLEGMDPGQAIDIVAGSGPDTGVPPDVTLRGFSHLARSSPGEFSKRAMDLAGAAPSAQEAFFRSMGSSLNDGKPIDWGVTIKLLEHVSRTHADGGYGNEETALAACSMLEDAFQHAPPGYEFREGLRRVVTSFAEASSPERDPHRESLVDDIIRDRPIDVINMSINTLEGRSLLVMLAYALWCHCQTGRRELVPEVKRFLDKYVEGEHTVHRDAILGSYLSRLHYLDRDWTLDMAKKACSAFPTRVAFWDGYVRWNPLNSDVFSDLQETYNEFLTGCMSEILKNHAVFKSTIDHYLSAYLYGYDVSGRTFEKFLRSVKPSSPDDLVPYIISQVEMVVRNVPARSPFDVKRFENLWIHKVFSRRELSYWFIESKVDDKESVRLYAEYMARYSGSTYLLAPILKELRRHAAGSGSHVLSALRRLAKMGPMYPSDAELATDIQKVLEKDPELDADDLKDLDELLQRAKLDT